jgi:hypothetical protein
MAASNRIIGTRIVNRAPRTGGAGTSAAIIGFPIARQRDVIANIAHAMIRKRSAKAADQYIGKALRRLMNELRRQGIPAATIRREVYAMEAQVRGAAWRLLFPWIETEKISRQRRCQKIYSRRRFDLADQLVFPWRDDQYRSASRCRASRG